MARIEDLTDQQSDSLAAYAGQIAHETSRHYNESIGEYIPCWAALKSHQRREPIKGASFYIDHRTATAEQSHSAWAESMTAAGWSYGEAKDYSAKTHPGLVEFDQLSEAQRAKAHVFRSVVMAFVDQHLSRIR